MSNSGFQFKSGVEGDLFSVIFQIANQWEAILLLDEADVYLEKRSSQNLHRNGLVSVFLRKLEYYTGILFLTTNHASESDEAIPSRIHVTLKYENLIIDARRELWKDFLERGREPQGAANISSKHLELLVQPELNGGQVRSQIGALLAQHRHPQY